MRKERFNDSLKISEFTRRTLLKRDWVAAAVERDIRVKSYRLPNCIMLFQPVLTKFFKSELFSCLPKNDHVIN